MKRILREIKLDKIAAVDAPCQEPATMTIMKRRPDADDPEVEKGMQKLMKRAKALVQKVGWSDQAVAGATEAGSRKDFHQGAADKHGVAAGGKKNYLMRDAHAKAQITHNNAAHNFRQAEAHFNNNNLSAGQDNFDQGTMYGRDALSLERQHGLPMAKYASQSTQVEMVKDRARLLKGQLKLLKNRYGITAKA